MHKYLIIIEKADDNYSAYSPDLPGCLATGNTVEETRKNMKEAIKFHLDGHKEEGLPMPGTEVISEYLTIG